MTQAAGRRGYLGPEQSAEVDVAAEGETVLVLPALNVDADVVERTLDILQTCV